MFLRRELCNIRTLLICQIEAIYLMCGIVAINASNGSTFEIAKALQAIEHRGPDDSGEWKSKRGECQLGHVRLSIIDLSDAGHQPMFDTSKRFVMVYNGEVYNYPDLKASLDSEFTDIPWQSDSDSEVIIEGFARKGDAFLSKLNGIFSLAIYDTEKEELVLLRDPLGIKPLYVTAQNGAMYFSSEVKGLKSIPEISTTIRKQSLADVLSFMYVPEPYTMYQEITKVTPGELQRYKNGILIDSSYLFHHLNSPVHFDGEQDIIEQFRHSFDQAVKRQLVSDVPVSLFLSGGLDSSAVTYSALQNHSNVKDAYTISFSAQDQKYDQQSDDLHYAKLLSDKLGIKLNVIESKQNLLDMLPELSPYMEDGLADPACINTYIIAKSARENGIKVMLSGQGADEYLGGYRRYLAEKMYRKIPNILLKLMSVGGKLLPNQVPGRFNGDIRRIKRFIDTASLPASERMLSLYMWNTPEKTLSMFKDSSKLEIGQEHLSLFEKFKNEGILDAMLKVDQKYDLMSLNLAYTDRMSMMVGLEARVPFLDFELVRLMNSIPQEMKIKNGTQKYVLKKAMEPYLPQDVIYRQKAGFALPIRSWLRKPSQLTSHYLDHDRIRKQGIFDATVVDEMCKEQFSGQKDHTYTLFSMLSLQIWLDDNT